MMGVFEKEKSRVISSVANENINLRFVKYYNIIIISQIDLYFYQNGDQIETKKRPKSVTSELSELLLNFQNLLQVLKYHTRPLHYPTRQPH